MFSKIAQISSSINIFFSPFNLTNNNAFQITNISTKNKFQSIVTTSEALDNYHHVVAFDMKNPNFRLGYYPLTYHPSTIFKTNLAFHDGVATIVHSHQYWKDRDDPMCHVYRTHPNKILSIFKPMLYRRICFPSGDAPKEVLDVKLSENSKYLYVYMKFHKEDHMTHNDIRCYDIDKAFEEHFVHVLHPDFEGPSYDMKRKLLQLEDLSHNGKTLFVKHIDNNEEKHYIMQLKPDTSYRGKITTKQVANITSLMPDGRLLTHSTDKSLQIRKNKGFLLQELKLTCNHETSQFTSLQWISNHHFVSHQPNISQQFEFSSDFKELSVKQTIQRQVTVFSAFPNVHSKSSMFFDDKLNSFVIQNNEKIVKNLNKV